MGLQKHFTIGAILLLVVGMFSMLFIGRVSSAVTGPQYVSDPANCPVQDDQFPGQKCPAGLVICGVNDDDIPQCYDYTAIVPPETTADSTTLYTAALGGGYIIDCYAQPLDAAAPYCDNDGAALCNRDETCYTDKRRATVCTAGSFGAFTCGSCRSGYQDCLGDDVCEVTTGVTSFPDEANSNYGESCTPQCNSGYLDCNANLGSAVDGCEIQIGGICGGSNSNAIYGAFCDGTNGDCGCRSGYLDCDGDLTTDAGQCEIQIGASCDTNAIYQSSCDGTNGDCQCRSGYYDCNGDLGTGGDGCEVETGTACTNDQGVSGIYDGCTCVQEKSYFETGTESTYSTSDALLWGTQVGTGDLIQMSNALGTQFVVTNSGVIKAGSELVLNQHNAAGDTTITFGNELGAQLLRYSSELQRFEFSGALHVMESLTTSGTLTVADSVYLQSGATIDGGLTLSGTVTIRGVEYSFPYTDGAPGYVLATDGSGNLRWKLDDTAESGMGTNEADARFVQKQGDTMTGALIVKDQSGAPAGLSVSTVLSGAHLRVDSNADIWGNLGVSGSLTLNTVTYTFPHGDGAASGKVLTTDGSGQLSWSDVQRAAERTFQPAYDGAVYQGDGTDNVGQLYLNHSGAILRNFYQWSSTRSSLQHYEVRLRVTLPSGFIEWSAVPFTVEYHSTAADPADNKLDIAVYDTAGVGVTLVGDSQGLASTAWTSTSLTYGGTPAWTPEGDLLIVFKLSAKENEQMHLGKLTLRYKERLSE